MKVCYAHDGLSPYDHLFLKYLLDKGHEVHLITFSPSNKSYGVGESFPIPRSRAGGGENLDEVPYFSRLNIHHFDTGFVPIVQLRVWAAHGINTCILKLLLRKIKPDVLNGHFITTYGFWSALSSFRPFLLTIWGSDILIQPRILRTGKLITKFVLKKADAVIVDSNVQKDAAIEYDCEPNKIVLFPWAVDLERFNPKVSGERIRKSLGWEENPIIFCTRWHKPIYGVKYLLYAVTEIIQEHPNARFMLGGCGSQTDEFKDFVAKKGLKKYVKFVGKLPHEEMPEYMAACDIYVSPSFSDGTSASLLEAMACSKPVVVSDIPGNLEWVTNSENGFIVPKADIGALAKANSELLRDEDLRKEFGARNSEIVKRRADLRRSLQIYEDTLVMLASKKDRQMNLSRLP